MTRHNFGWMVCDHVTAGLKATWTGKFHGLYTDIGAGSGKAFVLKPATFMNECGRSVAALINFYKISPSHILVVHDELELPFGRIELKAGGGTAGHNGLRSIKKHIGTDAFHRLRLGIGRPQRMQVSSYVLSRFSEDEEARLPDICEQAGQILIDVLSKKGGKPGD